MKTVTYTITLRTPYKQGSILKDLNVILDDAIMRNNIEIEGTIQIKEEVK